MCWLNETRRYKLSTCTAHLAVCVSMVFSVFSIVWLLSQNFRHEPLAVNPELAIAVSNPCWNQQANTDHGNP